MTDVTSSPTRTSTPASSQRRRRAAAALLLVAAVPVPLLVSAAQPADAAGLHCTPAMKKILGAKLCTAGKPHKKHHHKKKHHKPGKPVAKPYADRWIATVKGHAVSLDGTETIDWEAKSTFLRSTSPGSPTLWRELPGTASGTYHAKEIGEYCTHETTGTFDKVEGDIAVLPSLKQYWFDFFASGDGVEKQTCEGGTTTEETRVLGNAMSGGMGAEPQIIPWVFSGGSVNGSAHSIENGVYVTDVSWVLGPQ